MCISVVFLYPTGQLDLVNKNTLNLETNGLPFLGRVVRRNSLGEGGATAGGVVAANEKHNDVGASHDGDSVIEVNTEEIFNGFVYPFLRDQICIRLMIRSCPSGWVD